jgi:CheY-like chemotaxis protein
MKTTGKLSILLVDDEKHLLTTLGEYLEFSGYEVRPARSGEEALTDMDQKTPDIIILDIGMAGMGGLGFLKAISRDDGTPRCPVLILTAKVGMESFFSGLAVDGFLAKPCPEHIVLEKVEEILARKRAGAGGARRKVLIVEDDPFAMGNLRAVFEDGGFAVETVANGAEVMVEAALTQPSVVVINEVLAGTSGREVAALLAAMPSTRKLPVVIYDESHMPESRRSAHTGPAGRMERFVPSATPEVIRRAVEELLGA